YRAARRLPVHTLFPYTTLFRSERIGAVIDVEHGALGALEQDALAAAAHLGQEPPGGRGIGQDLRRDLLDLAQQRVAVDLGLAKADRKSTRLNSSHVKSSYAVFC